MKYTETTAEDSLVMVRVAWQRLTKRPGVGPGIDPLQPTAVRSISPHRRIATQMRALMLVP